MSKWMICPVCEGDGTLDNPNFSNGFTSSEMDEMGEDFSEDYFAGRYDVACKTCKSSGKIKSADYKRIMKELDAEAEMRAEVEAERRMGA